MLRYNPFKPGSIVHPGMFAGRFEEIKLLEHCLFQTLNGNPSHFILHGERGIGKSSLMLLINAYAIGEFESLYGKQYKFLTINIELEPQDQYDTIINKIARGLKRELDKIDNLKKLANSFWDFLTNWEVCGVKYNKQSIPAEEILENFTNKLEIIIKQLPLEFDGIYIFIDESDKAPIEAHLGEFSKLFLEKLTKRHLLNIGLGIIGISNVIDKMRQSHSSSVRMFQLYELEPLKLEERKDVITKALAEAEKKNNFKVEIEQNALDSIVAISEGYPHFIQQYGYSAFEQDSDNFIDRQDVLLGLFRDNGALYQLGVRYFENMYSKQILSSQYRTVLQVMAQNDEKYITRKKIIELSGLKEHVVGNAITALRKKNIIIPKKGVRGTYRLPSRSFTTWIKAFKLANSK